MDIKERPNKLQTNKTQEIKNYPFEKKSLN